MKFKPVTPTESKKMNALPWVLASGALNGIFVLWTFGGSVFLLFLVELGLPKGQIGMVLSIFPFCGLLALGFAPVAARLGRKRIFLACYGIRKLVMAALLLLPWIAVHGGQTTAVAFLAGVIIAFAILRAFAETAYYPWTQEFVPNAVRGSFAAWSAVVGLIASGAALAVAGHVIGAGTGLGRFMLLIGAGSFLGFLGALVMIKVPGGKPIPKTAKTASHVANMFEALRDHNFTTYLGGMAGITIGAGMLIAFLPLYVKEQLGLASATVVRLDIAVMVGGALSSLAWGWLADRVGSRPVLMPSVALLLLVPLGWVLLPRQMSHTVAWCVALYFVFGVAFNGAAIGAGRLLFNSVVPAEASTAYTAIYYAWMGVTGGIAPLLAGGILSAAADRQTYFAHVAVDGYTLLFTAAVLCLILGWTLYGHVRPDDVHTTRTVAHSFMNRITQR